MKTLYIGTDTLGLALAVGWGRSFNGVTIEQVANAYLSHSILLQFWAFRS